MAERHTISPAILRRLAAGQGSALETMVVEEAAGGPVPVTAQWVNAKGRKLGKAVVITPPLPWPVEFPAAGGSFARDAVEDEIALPRKRPSAATGLALEAFGVSETLEVSALGTLPEKLGKPQEHLVGAKKAKMVFPVIAERFTNFADFTAKLDEFHGWLLDQPPFNETAVGGNVAIKGLFWPSDPVTGLFDTRDPPSADVRLFFGNRQAAAVLLKKHLKGFPASLILINSSARGGAGGSPGFSAWSSIASDPGEFWGAVALHEIGHALGLADEYVDERFSLPEPNPLEPNVSAERDCSRVPWHTHATVSGAPSHPAGAPTAPLDVIGTFEGARYKPRGRYRPTQTCLMLTTLSPFCPICQNHIRARLR